eukprot:225272_1
MRMDFLENLDHRLADVVEDFNAKSFNKIMDAYSVFSKFRPVRKAKKINRTIIESANEQIHSLFSDFKYEDMWTMFTELDSRREFFDFPTESEVIADVMEDMMDLCTDTTNVVKRQMETFQTHFDSLNTSDRFSKFAHFKAIVLKRQMESFQKHFDFLTSDRFSKFAHFKAIVLKRQMESFQKHFDFLTSDRFSK